MRLTDYLGAASADLLSQEPFSSWSYTKSREDDLPAPEIRYEFDDRHVEMICDEADRISSIFLHRGADEALSPIPLNSSRDEVLRCYGTPTKSGAAMRDPILGDSGPSDRFESASHTVHIQYQVDADEISLITLMRPDIVP